MELIVCVKQVPDTTEVKIDEETGTIIREGVPSTLNSFDEYALNVALKLKENLDEDVNITAISMGPPQAEDALLKCLANGADRAILLTGKRFAGADTWATSLTLAKAIKSLEKEADLIFCGYEATDGNTAQVGPELARLLSLPVITYVEEILDVDLENKKIVCNREIDDGYMKIKRNFPALITCMTSPGFEPKIPDAREIFKAKTKSLIKWGPEDIGAKESKIGLKGSLSQVIKTYSPPSRGPRVKLEDKPEIEAEKGLKFLRDEGLLE